MLTSPIWALSWLLIATATDWKILFLGRIISGFLDGVALPSTQIYVTECTNPNIRGILGSIPMISMSTGAMMENIFGTLFEWRTVGWISCSISITFFFLLIFLPDSPHWLRHQGKLEAAQKASDWLELSHFEINEKDVTEKFELKANEKSKFLTRRVMMPLMIGLSLLVFQQLSGIDAIVFFTVEMFKAAGKNFILKILTLIIQQKSIFRQLSR